MMRILTQDFFAQSPALIFPLIALGLFMGVFILVSIRTFAARKESFDPMANLPLDDGPRSDGQITHAEGAQP